MSNGKIDCHDFLGDDADASVSKLTCVVYTKNRAHQCVPRRADQDKIGDALDKVSQSVRRRVFDLCIEFRFTGAGGTILSILTENF